MVRTAGSALRLRAVALLATLAVCGPPAGSIAQPGDASTVAAVAPRRFDPFAIDEVHVDARHLSIRRPGRFGYLFPTLVETPTCVLPFDADNQLNRGIEKMLRVVASEMKDDADPSRDSDIPAGITYLGQFINHDISFDPTPAGTTFRTPALNLDSLYGAGTIASASLYGPDGRIVLGYQGYDLRRTRVHGLQRGLMANARNDENLLVAQMHVAFARFHNIVVGRLASGRVPKASTSSEEGSLFERARQLVRWHYQWIIVHEFLPAVIDEATVADVLAHGPRFYRPTGMPFIPVEFSLAANRFGHSMVRESYDISRYHQKDGTLARLFHFTYRGEPPTPGWFVDWARFFRLPTTRSLNLARRIDTRVAAGLHDIPDVGSLTETTLVRGYAFRVPSGACVATLFGEAPLSTADLRNDTPSIAAACDAACPTTVAGSRILLERTPLWFYLLKEAEVMRNGNRLGPIGGRIVAEVLIGLLRADATSILHHPTWRPHWGDKPGEFGMADLLTVARLDEPPA
jgi:hypothetical protein